MITQLNQLFAGCWRSDKSQGFASRKGAVARGDAGGVVAASPPGKCSGTGRLQGERGFMG